MSVRLRPHHVLCAIGFEGHGYDDPFTANMSHIVIGGLRAPDGEDTRIFVGADADSICAPCPNRRGLGCTKQETVDGLDSSHAEALDLKPGDWLTWGDCLDRVVERVRPGDLTRICAGCEWLPTGICERALTRLHAERGAPSDAAPAGSKDRTA